MGYKLSKILNIPTRTKFPIFIGSILHDIGKFKIGKAVLNKPDRLSYEEFEIIKTHTDLNLKLVKSKVIKNIIMYHHENINGTGYRGITNIPYEAKLVRICDMFDALTHDRVYHEKITAIEALKIMVNNKAYFDSVIFSVFVRMVLCNKSYNPSYNSYLKRSLKDVQ